VALTLLGSVPVGLPAAQAQDSAAVREAEALAQSGRHLESAARYEGAAKKGFLSWDAQLALLAAREYAAAGEPAEAARMADKARGRVRTDEERALLALVEGTLALGRGDAATAAAFLRSAPMSVPNDLAADVLALRGRAQIAAGQPVAGLRSYEARRPLLRDDDARAANDRELFDQLLLHPPAPATLAEPGLSLQERGWLELPAVVAALGASAGTGGGADARSLNPARDWRLRYPAHPGAAFLPGVVGTAATLAVPGPDAAIAVLLPLVGRQEAAAKAVLDGFGAAWFASAASDARPRVEVYDTSSGAGAAYARAAADGARIVVGPLLKEDVLAVLAAHPSGLPLPTLALNTAVEPGNATPAFLYQFALDPEEEARAVARRIAEDGLTRGIALYPETAWGRRVQAAFEDELRRSGSVLLMSPAQFYVPGAKDFSGPLRAALGRFGGAGDRSADRSRPAPARDAAAEQAAGPQFAFVAASPQVARAIRPQLRFQMTYDLPVYATSDAWEPSVRSAADLEGMIYPEMPWLLFGGQGAPELWDAVTHEWQPRARGKLRLYAFGYDAFRLAQQLGSGMSVAGVQGLTGTLDVSQGQSHVRRSLQFARIEGGRPQPAAPGYAPLPGDPGRNPTDGTTVP
jgi:outer membrane PBP1 activator LpoA protein